MRAKDLCPNRVLLIGVIALFQAGGLAQAPRKAITGAEAYALLRDDRKVGSETWTSKERGNWHVDQKLENGQVLQADIRFDKGDLPIEVDCNGHDSDGKLVSDHFELKDHTATWRNELEHGNKLVAAPVFYLTFPIVPTQISAIPGELGWLARALIDAPRNSVTLLPSGVATLRQVQQLDVTREGERLTVTEFQITGLDFSPTPVWLDANRELFAALAPGTWTMIRDGWESSVSALRAAQRVAEENRRTVLANQLAHRPQGSVIFRHVTLFDSENGVLRSEMTVLVTGNHIQSVAKEGTTSFPSNAQVIDGRGSTLLPGLWDMHTHFQNSDDGMMHLASGVTTARDMGNYTRRIMEMRHDFEQGTRIGPRLWLAGLMDGASSIPSDAEIRVGSEKEALDAVEWFHRLGFVQTKIYGQIKPEWVPGIVRRSHELGMRVSGHVPAFMTASQAVADGFDELNHTHYLFLNFMPDVTDTVGPARYMAPAERAADLDLNSRAVSDFIALLKDHRVVVDPTLGISETRYTARRGHVDPGLAPVFDRLPLRWKRNALTGGVPTPPEKERRYQSSFQAFLKMAGLLYRAGVPLVVGSDSWPGIGFDRELELHVDAGIPAQQVLQDATINAARLMGEDALLGSVRAAKLADLVLVEGDPVADIGNMRRVKIVMKDGVVYSAAELNRAVGMGVQN